MEGHQIAVAGLVVDVVRKDIKHLHLAVYPPAGRVRVAAPLRLDDEAVRLAVVSRLGWIRQQQAKFAEQERETEREYLSGESHYFQGARYRLNVIYQAGRPGVAVRNNRMLDLIVRPGSDRAQRERVMLEWYRQQLKDELARLVPRWEQAIGVTATQVGVKQMKTKWGTCNTRARRLWLNLELAKKPARCLEFVLVHELVHLLERHHNAQFQGLMDRHLPQWRLLRDELNREPLGHATWDY
ncbi:MAG: M48 family metallopeptidase [Anaerolineales bacterium]|nr:M48 family metallopeptidase [Anaerolineales bacterium]